MNSLKSGYRQLNEVRAKQNNEKETKGMKNDRRKAKTKILYAGFKGGHRIFMFSLW